MANLDSLRVYDSIIGFANQVSTTWTQIAYSTKLDRCSRAENIVISGMGGSALGGRIIQSLSQFILKAPLELVTNYRLPAYVGPKSLVVLSSYSGDTEETISCCADALKRKAQVFIITTGGKLASVATKYQLPSLIFTPSDNPSNLPRMGLGYSITAQLALLSHCRFIDFTPSDIEQIVTHLNSMTKHLASEVTEKNNPAKVLAEKSKNRFLVLISANHLVGTAHAVKNMINENSKTFAASFDLPELNHHLLEGLSFPKGLKDKAHFLVLSSDLYPEVIKHRLEITKRVFTKFGYEVTTIKPDSSTPLTQAYETLYFGQFLSYYLGIINAIDPGPIPWVDYFKTELQKHQHRI